MLQPSNNSTEIWFKRGVRHSALLYIHYILHAYLWLLSPVCTVHYNRAPVTGGTPHAGIKTHLLIQIMFNSSHEIELSF
jgi:hypothetical protein